MHDITHNVKFFIRVLIYVRKMNRFHLQYLDEFVEKYAIFHGSLTYFLLTFARKTRDLTVRQQRTLRCHILISLSLRIRVIYAL